MALLEGLNVERAERIERAMTAYCLARGEDVEDYDDGSLLVDLLTDAQHWARHTEQDFDDALRVARGHFKYETDINGEE